MSERGPSFKPDKPERTPRGRMIAAMEAYDELGPNARTPENGSEILEIGIIVTDDEATYIAGTLGPATAE